MNEYKFRAWDEEAEIMFYSHETESDYFFEFVDGKLRGFAIRPPRPSSDPMEPPQPYVDDYPVMQSTGQRDKDGKEELYQDDICKANYTCMVCFDNEPHELIGTIEQSDNGLWMFDYGHGAMPLMSPDLSDIEKVGDIHTTPEKLEAEK